LKNKIRISKFKTQKAKESTLSESLNTLEYRIAQLSKELFVEFKEIDIISEKLISSNFDTIKGIIHFNQILLKIGKEKQKKMEDGIELKENFDSYFKNKSNTKEPYSVLTKAFRNDLDIIKRFVEESFKVYIDFFYKKVFVEEFDDCFNFLKINVENLSVGSLGLFYLKDEISSIKILERFLPLINEVYKMVDNYEKNIWFISLNSLVNQLKKFRNMDVLKNYLDDWNIKLIIKILIGDSKLETFELKKLTNKLELFLIHNIRDIILRKHFNKVSEEEFSMLKILMKYILKNIISYTRNGTKYYVISEKFKPEIKGILAPFFDYDFQNISYEDLNRLCNEVINSDSIASIKI